MSLSIHAVPETLYVFLVPGLFWFGVSVPFGVWLLSGVVLLFGVSLPFGFSWFPGSSGLVGSSGCGLLSGSFGLFGSSGSLYSSSLFTEIVKSLSVILPFSLSETFKLFVIYSISDVSIFPTTVIVIFSPGAISCCSFAK